MVLNQTQQPVMDKRAIFYIDDEYDRQLLREMVEEHQEDVDELSEDEEDAVEEQKEDSDTEQENDDDTDSEEELLEQLAGMIRMGRDGITKWLCDKPPETKKSQKRSLVSHLPGAKGKAKAAKTVKDCWECFVDETMISLIVECTNEKIKTVQAKYSRERDAKLTNATEIKALVAVLYICAAKKDNHTNTRDIFATDKMGTELCRLIMPERRFKFLLYCLRFDHKETRGQRKEVDNLAPVRELFDSFVKNCQQSYCIGEFCTVDAKVELFRGKCKFRQFIPNKSNNYGIKVYLLSDAKTYYTHKLEVYVGKQPDGPFKVSNKPQDVVMRLCSDILGSRRNITTDSWFTSLHLAEELLRHKLTLVGSIKKNKREIPSSFVNVRGRTQYSSKFAYRDSCTLVSFVPRKNRNVLLLSTLQHDLEGVSPADPAKPDVLQFYTATKSAVDKVDHMCCAHSVSRMSNRWPMVLFYCVLNLAGINAHVVYRGNQGTGPPVVRSRFLKLLARELADAALKERAECRSLPRELRLHLNEVVPPQTEEPAPEASRAPHKRRRCYKCGRAKSRLTQYRCVECTRYICLQHAAKMCQECVS